MSKSSRLKTFICLRCQNRLYSDQGSHHVAPLRKFNTSKSRSFANQASNKLNTDEQTTKEPIPVKFITSPGPGLSLTRQWMVPLDQQSLGVPTEVVVLRDGDGRRFGEDSADSAGLKDNQPLITAGGILASMKAHTPAQEDVIAKIELVAPSRSTFSDDQPPILQQDEYDRKFCHLYEQFNYSQLSSYLEIKQAAQLSNDHTDSMPSMTKRFRKSPWRSLSTNTDGSEFYIPAQYSLKSPKARVVNKIMSILWNIQIVEDAVQLGEIELRLDQTSLSLLLAGEKQSVLRTIGTEMSAKIEVFRSDGLIRITAPRVTSAKVVDRITRLFNDCHESVFNLRLFQPLRSRPAIPDPHALLALCRNSRSTVEVSRDKKKLILRSLSAMESQHANRMLFALVSNPIRTSKTLILGEECGSRRMICAPVSQSDSLAFQFRYKPLGRLVAAAEFEESGSNGYQRPTKLPAPRMDHTIINELSQLIEGPEKLHSSEQSFQSRPMNVSRWQGSTRVYLHCNFGKIIHPRAEDWFEPLSEEKLEEFRTGRHQKFDFDAMSPFGSNVVKGVNLPGNSDSLVDAQSTRRETLRIQLIPQIMAVSDDSTAAPALELLLAVEMESQSVRVESLEAILNRKELGVMFPSLSADLQFVESTRAQIIDPTAQPALESFLREVENHLVGFGKVQTPPNVQIQIPKAFTSSAAAKCEDATEDIEYIVSEIQYEQSASYDCDSFKLVFTHREGGDVGGRREEMSLQVELDGPEQSKRDSNAIASCEDSVVGIEDSAASSETSTGEVALSSKSRESGYVEAFVHYALELLDQVELYGTRRAAKRLKKKEKSSDPVKEAIRSNQSL